MKKILVVTMTCGRLDVSKQWVPTLAQKAGYPYKHVIVDNGSQDGSADWFEQQGYDVIRNSTNEGLVKGWTAGYEKFSDWGPDYVIRMDDDCNVITDNLLASIVAFYEANGRNYIVSPMNIRLPNSKRYMPKTIDERKTLNGFKVNLTTHSGLFVTVPVEAFTSMINDGGLREGDNRRGTWWRNNGYPTAYLTNLHVDHMGRGTSTYEKYVY